MSLILNIETSTKVCSVCLALDGEAISIKEVNSAQYVHSEKLNVLINEVFSTTKYSFSDLNAICVSKGPGSFTGLRIGVSTAKGICYALDIPLISIDSLSILVNLYVQKNPSVASDFMPMIDARRMEVYTGIFDRTGKPTEPIRAQVIDEDTFNNYSATILLGDGANKLKDIVMNHNVSIVEGFETSALGMIKSSLEKYKNEDFEDTAYFEPYYLKDFMAGPKKS